LAGNKEAVAGQRLRPSGECSHRSTPPRHGHSICSRWIAMYILRGDVRRPVRTIRGDKEWEAN
jgi:hypothetical protein